NLWGELSGQQAGLAEPLAPTLARHAKPSSYQVEVYTDLAHLAREVIKAAGLDQPSAWTKVASGELVEPQHPLDELTATLLYRTSQAPYRNILAVVQRSEEHTSELQSRFDLVCRLLPETTKQSPAPLGWSPRPTARPAPRPRPSPLPPQASGHPRPRPGTWTTRRPSGPAPRRAPRSRPR